MFRRSGATSEEAPVYLGLPHSHATRGSVLVAGRVLSSGGRCRRPTYSKGWVWRTNPTDKRSVGSQVRGTAFDSLSRPPNPKTGARAAK